jgi:hypothetical protein
MSPGLDVAYQIMYFSAMSPGRDVAYQIIYFSATFPGRENIEDDKMVIGFFTAGQDTMQHRKTVKKNPYFSQFFYSLTCFRAAGENNTGRL